uniref:von Willebrand factor C and EGF domain-containing protein-like n=1 Tax=Myxine glutinosa TaxID=7769 RepID=UPI00358FF5A9
MSVRTLYLLVMLSIGTSVSAWSQELVLHRRLHRVQRYGKLAFRFPNDIDSGCGLYGCEVRCNVGGCRPAARVCPPGYQLLPAPGGVRCLELMPCGPRCLRPCTSQLPSGRGSICPCLPHRTSCQGLSFASLVQPASSTPLIAPSLQPHPTHRIPSAVFAPSMHLSPAMPTSSYIGPPGCWIEESFYPEGSPFNSTNCRKCICEGGVISCQDLSCPANCSIPGSCCSHCPSSAKHSYRCVHEGTVRNEGETFSGGLNNCSVCVCLGGQINCITPSCPPIICNDPLPHPCCPFCSGECIHLGQAYEDGSVFVSPADNCTTCTCQAGEMQCRLRQCPPLLCPPAQQEVNPGDCCPHCQTQLPGCLVDDNGLLLPVGQLWSPGDPCEVCMCKADGKVECKRTQCLETCSHPVPIPGQCCPNCLQGCLYDDEVRGNNMSFTPTSDPCSVCVCLAGSVACAAARCKVSCPYPFHRNGACCPVCHDCNYLGRKVLNGQQFHPAARPCHLCTCMLGEVSCEPVSCDAPCDQSLIECCPSCRHEGSEADGFEYLRDKPHVNTSSTPNRQRRSSRRSKSATLLKIHTVGPRPPTTMRKATADGSSFLGISKGTQESFAHLRVLQTAPQGGHLVGSSEELSNRSLLPGLASQKSLSGSMFRRFLRPSNEIKKSPLAQMILGTLINKETEMSEKPRKLLGGFIEEMKEQETLLLRKLKGRRSRENNSGLQLPKGHPGPWREFFKPSSQPGKHNIRGSKSVSKSLFQRKKNAGNEGQSGVKNHVK